MASEPAPVLVGIDGTVAGTDAVALGRALAALLRAPLVLGAVHGHDSLASLFGPLGSPRPEAAWEWLRDAERGFPVGEPFRARVIGADSVARGLAALAERERASLIVLGASRRGAAARLRGGTGARRIIDVAPCPVAVAPPGWRAWAHPARPIFAAGMGEGAESAEALALAAELAALAGAGLRKLVAPDEPATRLAAAAADVDLLVIGSRRPGPVRHALHESVSAALADVAACPLLVVPRGARFPVAHAAEAARTG